MKVPKNGIQEDSLLPCQPFYDIVEYFLISTFLARDIGKTTHGKLHCNYVMICV